MGKRAVSVFEYNCERCRHKWVSRLAGGKVPKVCAGCHSAYWNEPRKNKKKEQVKSPVNQVKGASGNSVKQPVRMQPARRTTPGRGSRFSTAVRRAGALVGRKVPSQKEIDLAGIGGAT
jgi:hypothetical protein